MRFQHVPLDEVDWAALDRFADRTHAQRLPWLNYLTAIGAGQPLVALLEDEGKTIGCFTAMRGKRLGLPVLGSPIPGWNTGYMGLNLAPEVPRADALHELSRFAFRDQGCAYLELSDPMADFDSAAAAGYSTVKISGFASDLTLSEDALFARMASATRRCIRKAEREGVTVEEAAPEGFAAEFHAQLVEVFARQGLMPTYSRERVEKLIEHVHPSGSLLLLRARAPGGESIATGIFAGFGRYSTFWGNGSVTSMLHLRPNQALHWHAMRYWKARGVHLHDWGGTGDYKKNYGPDEYRYIRQYRSALPWLDQVRGPALKSYKKLRAWRSRRLAEQQTAAE